MNLLVVEDQEKVIEEIRDILHRIDSSIHIVGVTEHLKKVPHWLRNNRVPDLILVNEEMSGKVSSFYPADARAVITFSIKSRPHRFDAFRFPTFKNILQQLGSEQIPETNLVTGNAVSRHRERFLVKQGQRLISVSTSDIAYFFSEERFIFFRTRDNQKFVTEYRMEQLEQMLDPSGFFRVNRSCMVSLASVEQIHAYFGNRLKLYLNPPPEKEVIVSRERVRRFKEWLGK